LGLTWKEHKLQSGTIKSFNGGLCKLRTKAPIKVAGVKAISKTSGDYYVTSFSTQKGKVYKIAVIK
jgi:alpha-L-fucosidase 2